MGKLKIYRFWPHHNIRDQYGDVFDDAKWSQITGNYRGKDMKTLITTVDKKSYDDLKLALETAANQLEGVALAFQIHGTALNVDFFIENYRKFAERARNSIK